MFREEAVAMKEPSETGNWERFIQPHEREARERIAREAIEAPEYIRRILNTAGCVLEVTFTFLNRPAIQGYRPGRKGKRGRMVELVSAHQAAMKVFDQFVKLLASCCRYNANIAYLVRCNDKISWLSDFENRPHIKGFLISNVRLDAAAIGALWGCKSLCKPGLVRCSEETYRPSYEIGGCRVTPCDLRQCSLKHFYRFSTPEGMNHHPSYEPDDFLTVSTNLRLFDPQYRPSNKHQRQVFKRHVNGRSRYHRFIGRSIERKSYSYGELFPLRPAIGADLYCNQLAQKN
jgi:hypothetical protein